MTFIVKLEKLIQLTEEYIANKNSKAILLDYVKDLEFEDEFTSKDLFRNIFNEFKNSIDELSRKELKQRVLLMKTFSVES